MGTTVEIPTKIGQNFYNFGVFHMFSEVYDLRSSLLSSNLLQRAGAEVS